MRRVAQSAHRDRADRRDEVGDEGHERAPGVRLVRVAGVVQRQSYAKGEAAAESGRDQRRDDERRQRRGARQER